MTRMMIKVPFSAIWSNYNQSETKKNPNPIQSKFFLESLRVKLTLAGLKAIMTAYNLSHSWGITACAEVE